jgi:pyruvate dehydrogenase E2 component (dihydrolipoamide acetyltransferase)
MAEVIRMPLLSDTMKEGIIAEWHKKVGDTVKSDDVIADVETDKATMEVMPYVDGTLLYIGVEKGKGVPVNGIMAIIGKPGEDFSALLAADNTPTNTSPKTTEIPVGSAKQNTVTPPVTVAPAIANEVVITEAGTDERLKASPLAKKMAEEKGLNIQQIKGSGDGGRIIKRDVDSYTPQAVENIAVPVNPVNLGQESYTDTPLSQMRRIIAQRLAESKFSAPHFYLRITVNMDNAIQSRKAINDVSPVKVSFNELIIKACAMALRQHPFVNSSWMGDFIRKNNHIHIGTAVAVDEGLIVPVIKFADQKSLSQISQEASSLIEKARNKKLQPPEFTGNTFTISNLGMMDIDEFTAIINPPDSCILAVGKIAATPVAENGAIVVRNLLKLTLSCDHRVVDGAVGSRFLQTLKTHLENPVTMLV